MTTPNRLRDGSRNRQLRVFVECWPLWIPAMAIVIGIIAPLVQWVRVLFRG